MSGFLLPTLKLMLFDLRYRSGGAAAHPECGLPSVSLESNRLSTARVELNRWLQD
jgi:hypothetical protein